MKLKYLIALAALPLLGQTVSECESLKRHGKSATACYQALANSRDPYLRAEGLWALSDWKGSNDAFRLAVAHNDKNAHYRVRWGRMYYDHSQPTDAAKLYEEALEIDPKSAEAYVGLALLAAENWEQKAAEYANKALAIDPKMVEAQELLARIALEDNNPEKAVKEADKAIAMSAEALDALAIRATVDWMDDKKETPWMDKILKINPTYGEAYATAAHFFVINRRYEEGIEFYRKALKLDPSLLKAKSELGINLMRLGREDEARRLLEECFEAGFKSASTVNTLRLMDTYKNFKMYETPKTILRLNSKEAEVLRPFFQAELDRAIATYEKKYKLKLAVPVQLEVYPNHEDFAVRTMGMPGLGALGVTFGTVVAMDSPSGRPPGQFHWASTLWHELSHVYVLTATKHRVPRWFTEGMAVHEETAVSTEWGDRLDASAIKAIEDKKLLPIAELDRGFVHPTGPTQVIVSYFQAGRICDYINGKWGYDKLLAMMNDFATNMSTPEVVEKELGMKPEAFDKEFIAWLEAQTRKTVSGIADWRKSHRNLVQLAGQKKYDEVIAEGNAIRDIYPDYVESSSVYELLSEAYLAKGDKAAATLQLAQYAKTGGRNPKLLKKLASLYEENGKKAEAAAALERLNFVYPVDEELHRRLGGLYLDLGKNDQAIRELGAVVAAKPLDVAGANYQLARAYLAAKKKNEAREAVLNALEAAPGFKEAQKLLLSLEGVQP